MQILKRIILVSFLASLTACTSFTASVITYEDGSKLKRNETFIVMPLSNQSVFSKSFNEVASLITSALEKEGFKSVSEPAKARYFVYYEFKVEEKGLVTYNAPVYGTVGTEFNVDGYSNSYGNSYYNSYNSSHDYYSNSTIMVYETPVQGIVGYKPKQQMIYSRILYLDIYKNTSTGQPTRAYSRFAINYSGDYSLEKVKGCLTKALFTNFPGENHSKEKVEFSFCN